MSDREQELADLVPHAVDGSLRALQKVLQIIHPQVLRYCRARIGGRAANPPRKMWPKRFA